MRRRTLILPAILLLAGAFGAASSAIGQGPTQPCLIRLEIDDPGGHEGVDLQRDLVTRWYGKPTPAHAHVVLSAAEKDTLCTILAEGRVFDLPDVYGNGSPRMSPVMADFHFDVRMGSRHRELLWRPDWDPSARRGKPGPDPRQDFLFEFYYRLEAMLHRKSTYRALPNGLARM